MAHLAPIELDDGTIIYIEAEEEISASPMLSEEPTRVSKGVKDVALRQFQALKGTIRAYATYSLDAFKEMANANVDKVTLEFGIKVAGEGGVPYITKSSGECNLKVTVECSFPK
ncbi:MAG: hypothetical protein J7647_26390 [Cyanobacteria bacterium SBLK]|nr:hypothetical protein [Cyanobacteria bacterium SBLK]